MAVNLGIGQRNTKSGIQGNRKTAQIPTGPSRTVGVANDPGVAGGPSSIPAGAFGPDGNVDAGRQIQAGANTIIADVVRGQRAADAETLRQQLRQEEVEIGAILKESTAELGNLSGKVKTRIHSGPGLSPVDQYKADSQKLMDERMADVNKMQMSPGSKQKLERQLQGRVNVHNSAVAKTLQDLQDNEFIAFVDRSYSEAGGRHKTNIVSWLESNKSIDQDTRLLLGDTKANEMFKAANETAVLSKYDSFFGTGYLDQAEEALNDPATRVYLSGATLREKFKDIQDARIQSKVDQEVAKQRNTSSRYQNLTAGGLWDNVEGKIVAGTEDPAKGVVSTPGGSFQWVKSEDLPAGGDWQKIKGSEAPQPQTKDEIRRETVDFMKEHGMLLTPGRMEMLVDLVPEKRSEFMEKLTAVDTLPFSPERKAELKADIVGQVPDSKLKDQEALIKSLGLSKEEETKALKSIATDKADLRSPKDKGIDEGREAAYKDFEERRVKDVLIFSEPFKVDSKATNSIRTLAERYVEAVKLDGRVKLLDGGAEMLGRLTSSAEELLKTGQSDSIGQAVHMAYHDIPMSERPVPVTGLSQVQARLKETGNVNAIIPDATIIKDANAVAATTPQVMQDIEDLDLSGTFMIDGVPTSLSIEQATGIKSTLQALAGATVSQLPGLGFLESREVTQSRLVFSLIARDVVRLISLSPRFAVREQQLIQSMFPGPGMFNSPRQALNKIKTMQGFIDAKLKTIQKGLKRTNISFEVENDLVNQADGLIDMKGRMNMFTFDLVPIEAVQTAAAVKKLGSDKALKFAKSLSPAERASLPTPVLRQLSAYKKAKKQAALDAAQKAKKAKRKNKNK